MPVAQIVLSALRHLTARWRAANPARHAGVLLGVLGMTAGAGLLAAGSALAGVGAQPGDLQLSASTGALSSTPTWSTTDGCPSGFQVSAELSEYSATGVFQTRISPVVDLGLTGPFSGTLDGNVGALLHFAGVNATAPGTVEWVIGCYAAEGGTGTPENEMSIFVSVAAGATTYTSSASAPSGTPTSGMSSSMSPSPSISPSPSPSPSASASPASSPTPSATSTTSPAPTSTPSAPATSSSLPSGAPQTGFGGASSSGPGTLLIVLGAAALIGSAGATGLAIRRRRRLPGEDPLAPTDPGGSW
jgi:hypothetical protein